MKILKQTQYCPIPFRKAPAIAAVLAVTLALAASSASAQVIFSEDFSSTTITDNTSINNPNFNNGLIADLPAYTAPTTGELVRDFTTNPGGALSAGFGFTVGGTGSPGALTAGDYTLTIDYNYDFGATTLLAGAAITLYFEALDWNGGGTAIQFANAFPLNSTNVPTDTATNHSMDLFSNSIDLSGTPGAASGTLQLDFTLPANLDQSDDAYAMAIRIATPGYSSGTASFDNLVLTQIPEPSSTALLALAGIGLVFLRKRS